MFIAPEKQHDRDVKSSSPFDPALQSRPQPIICLAKANYGTCLNYASSSLTPHYPHALLHYMIFFSLSLGLLPVSSNVRAIILVCSMFLLWTPLNHLIVAAPLTLSSVSLCSLPMTTFTVLFLNATVYTNVTSLPTTFESFLSFFPTVLYQTINLTSEQPISTCMNMLLACFTRLYYWPQ